MSQTVEQNVRVPIQQPQNGFALLQAPLNNNNQGVQVQGQNADQFVPAVVDLSNDGEFSFSEMFKNLFLGIISPITFLFSDYRNLLMGLGMTVALGVLTVLTSGATIPLFFGLGIGYGLVQAVIAAYKIVNAKNGDDIEKSFFNIGASLSAFATTVPFAKPLLGMYGVNADKYNFFTATVKLLREVPNSIRRTVGTLYSETRTAFSIGSALATEGTPASSRVITVNNNSYTVQQVPREQLASAYGRASGDLALVRSDLSPGIKRFVEAHEVYHLHDKSNWGGWIGREIRANIYPGLRYPIGLIRTILASLFSKERLLFYLHRFIRGA